ncbi:MAG: MerR family transcriptional regulator [Tannerella sp.]|jgi:DNA-binding transcriptional MerR regulator|nr:MerR family transcriptional regulator [Tannerella sp.]
MENGELLLPLKGVGGGAKQFYSIKEVAKMFNLNPSALRFWETKFEQIAPLKNKGTRFYSREDISQIRLIHYLLKIRGMTIAGAHLRLKDNKDETVNQEEIYNRLEQIRHDLQTIIDALDDYEKR